MPKMSFVLQSINLKKMYAQNLIHAFPIINPNLNQNRLNLYRSDNQNEALTHRKFASISKSRLKAHFTIYRLLMKGQFDVYLLTAKFEKK